jgi:hypothetical protein
MQNYRAIWKKHFGEIPVDENGQTYEIHHIDRNRNNNSIENLMCISKEEHIKIHFEAGEFAAAYAILKRKKGVSKKDFSGWNHSDLTKKKISESLKGSKNPMYGKKRPDRVGNGFWKGKKQPKEMVEKRRLKNLGQKRPKQSELMKGRYAGINNPMYGKTGAYCVRSVVIIDKETNRLYFSMKEYCQSNNTSMYKCRKMIKNGRLKCTT